MTFAFYDPAPSRNEYCTFYLMALVTYGFKNDKPVEPVAKLEEAKNCTLFILTDYLTDETIQMLKNNGVRIVGFNVTDSSYISGACRYAVSLSMVDLIFMLSGVQTKNEGFEMVVNKDFTIGLEKRQFLVESAWEVFDYMRKAGRLQSLPYVHWSPPIHVPSSPYAKRNQQVLIRGGGHMRRFILALKLHSHGLLDCNSGFTSEPYFNDNMTPQFRYCDECRAIWKTNHSYPVVNSNSGKSCANPMWQNGYVDMSEPGRWNNRCPHSFYAFAKQFGCGINDTDLERLLNARWLSQKDHFDMLARIAFTSDLKWLFSVYAAQRFWDAASVGCVNFLPSRTMDQEHFPELVEAKHYMAFDETLNYLERQTRIDELAYSEISSNAKGLYETWIKATDFSINTNLLKHIFEKTELLCGY